MNINHDQYGRFARAKIALDKSVSHSLHKVGIEIARHILSGRNIHSIKIKSDAKFPRYLIKNKFTKKIGSENRNIISDTLKKARKNSRYKLATQDALKGKFVNIGGLSFMQTPRFELTFSNKMKKMNLSTEDKTNILITKSITNILERKGLALEYFEEDEHPRGKGGRFASKQGGGRDYENNNHSSSSRSSYQSSNEEPSYGYDREAVRERIRQKDKKIHDKEVHERGVRTLKTVAMLALMGTAAMGHSHIATAIAAPWFAYETTKLAIKATHAAQKAVFMFGARSAGRIAAMPVNAVRGFGRAVSETGSAVGQGFSRGVENY